MNNFVFSQDPLLFQSYQPMQATRDELEAKQRKLNDMVIQYNQYPKPTERDYVGELDALMRSLNGDIAEDLQKNEEYVALNGELQNIIQEEIMGAIRWKLNGNPLVIKNIEAQKALISKEKTARENEDRKNISEINDYVKNYSNITFDEYKKLKSTKK